MTIVDIPGWGPTQVTVFTCSTCHEEFYIGRVEATPGFGQVDADAMSRRIIGNPPRCAECRAEP